MYENKLVYQNDDFSIMAETTEIAWLQFIPNQQPNANYIAKIYAEAYKLGEFLKTEGFGEQNNIAKIGNKLPYYHIHLVMRIQNDGAWPEPIWCLDNITKSIQNIAILKTKLKSFLS